MISAMAVSLGPAVAIGICPGTTRGIAFYDGSRREMRNEIVGSEVRAKLLAWIATTLRT
jgi:hypothetical protein